MTSTSTITKSTPASNALYKDVIRHILLYIDPRSNRASDLFSAALVNREWYSTLQTCTPLKCGFRLHEQRILRTIVKSCLAQHISDIVIDYDMTIGEEFSHLLKLRNLSALTIRVLNDGRGGRVKDNEELKITLPSTLRSLDITWHRIDRYDTSSIATPPALILKVKDLESGQKYLRQQMKKKGAIGGKNSKVELKLKSDDQLDILLAGGSPIVHSFANIETLFLRAVTRDCTLLERLTFSELDSTTDVSFLLRCEFTLTSLTLPCMNHTYGLLNTCRLSSNLTYLNIVSDDSPTITPQTIDFLSEEAGSKLEKLHEFDLSLVSITREHLQALSRFPSLTSLQPMILKTRDVSSLLLMPNLRMLSLPFSFSNSEANGKPTPQIVDALIEVLTSLKHLHTLTMESFGFGQEKDYIRLFTPLSHLTTLSLTDDRIAHPSSWIYLLPKLRNLTLQTNAAVISEEELLKEFTLVVQQETNGDAADASLSFSPSSPSSPPPSILVTHPALSLLDLTVRLKPPTKPNFNEFFACVKKHYPNLQFCQITDSFTKGRVHGFKR